MSKMLFMTILAALLLAGSLYTGKADARGGGPAETMPLTSFTDLPPYRPKPLCRTKRWCSHPRYYPPYREYW